MRPMRSSLAIGAIVIAGCVAVVPRHDETGDGGGIEVKWRRSGNHITAEIRNRGENDLLIEMPADGIEYSVGGELNGEALVIGNQRRIEMIDSTFKILSRPPSASAITPTCVLYLDLPRQADGRVDRVTKCSLWIRWVSWGKFFSAKGPRELDDLLWKSERRFDFVGE